MISNDKKEKIACEVIRTLYSRFNSFPEDSSNNRNAPFHKAFINAFKDKLEDKVNDIPNFISLSSWMHGLNTTLGQSFFENVAHILSDGEKKAFTKKSKSSLSISNEQKIKISDIITDLKNGNHIPNLSRENTLIFESDLSTQLVEANDFTADVFYESNEDVIAIELKSVRPNAGEMRGEKQKILEAKAELLHKYPNKNIYFYIGFPFDPTSDKDVEFDVDRFLVYLVDGKKYFDKEEVLLAGDLWDFLADSTNTMEGILNIINDIATPDFMNNYKFLLDTKNQSSSNDEYLELLKKWHLYEEFTLVNNISEINSLINGNSQLIKIYNQSLFKNDGKYNVNRLMKLKEIL